MVWKKKLSNIIVAALLSVAYTIVTLMNVIGPLHSNMSGEINQISSLAAYSVIYWLFSLAITWTLYFKFRSKPEFLFFTLIILGIALIIIEVFIWGAHGSGPHTY